MKKSSFHFLLLLFLPLLLSSQTVTVSDQLILKDEAYYEVIPDGRGNVLLFLDQQNKVEVRGYDHELRKRWEKELELDKKRPRVIQAVPMGSDFCVFYEFRHKLQPVLKVHRYSPGANLVDSTTIRIFEKLFYSPNYEIVVSEDKQTALIWFIEDMDKFNVFSFSMKNMELLWETQFTVDDFLYQRDFVQMLTDNEGNMYLVLDRKNRKAKADEHHFEVFVQGDLTGGQMRRHLINMANYLTFDVLWSFDNLNKNLVAAGLYSVNNTMRAEGYFFFHAKAGDFTSQQLKFYEFEDEFVKVLLESDKERLKHKSIAEVTVQDIVHRRDGGIIMIAELYKRFQRGVTSSSYYARTGIRPITDYYYDDVFMISLHPNGDEHWKIILHKKQYSQDDDGIYSSYFLAKTPAALRLVYNDEVKTENTVSEYIVKADGSFDHDSVMNTERKDLGLLFRYGVQVSADAFIVPSERRHRLKLVKVVL